MAGKDNTAGPGTTTENGSDPADRPTRGLLERRLPADVAASLTHAQRDAVGQLIGAQAWFRPPVNIRVTVPFIDRRFYVTIVGGVERRSPERRADDRQRYPLRTIANVFFFVGMGTVFYIVALMIFAMQASIVEF